MTASSAEFPAPFAHATAVSTPNLLEFANNPPRSAAPLLSTIAGPTPPNASRPTCPTAGSPSLALIIGSSPVYGGALGSFNKFTAESILPLIVDPKLPTPPLTADPMLSRVLVALSFNDANEFCNPLLDKLLSTLGAATSPALIDIKFLPALAAASYNCPMGAVVSVEGVTICPVLTNVSKLFFISPN